MPLYINVVIYPGVTIEEAALKAVELANRLNVDVWFEFNDVHCLARPGDNPLELIKSFTKELLSNNDIKSASDHSREFSKKPHTESGFVLSPR